VKERGVFFTVFKRIILPAEETMLSYDALNAEVSFTLHIEARRGTSDLS
jgi:hypothetical protein